MMTNWPYRPLRDLSEETQEAIAEDLRDPGPAAGDHRDADLQAARDADWLASLGL